MSRPELDVLVMDMPPGTGDIQLTMAQRIPVAGALIVTTPSSLATADVKRAVAMFEKTEIPIIGLVENMAYLDAPDGSRLHPFGKGGTELAESLGLTIWRPCRLTPPSRPAMKAVHRLSPQRRRGTPRRPWTLWPPDCYNAFRRAHV